MVLNDKYHFMCLGKGTKSEVFILNNFIFNDKNEEKILGITNGNKLTFKSHIKNICKQPPRKKGLY